MMANRPKAAKSASVPLTASKSATARRPLDKRIIAEGSSRDAAVDRDAAEEVGHEGDRAALVQHQALADADADAPAQVLEIRHRAVMHVRRLVPCVGQRGGHRHPAERDLQARAPVAEIWEADDRFAA